LLENLKLPLFFENEVLPPPLVEKVDGFSTLVTFLDDEL
jgi:hypothetical protein